LGGGGELRAPKYSRRVRIGGISFLGGKLCQEGSLGVYAYIERGAFVLPVGGGEDGISGSGGAEFLGSNAVGGNPCGLFGGED